MADASRTSKTLERAMDEIPVEQETLLGIVLNHALEAEANFLHLYDVAIRKASEGEVGEKLRAFRKDHENRVLELRGLLDAMGLPVVAEDRPTPLAEGLGRRLEAAQSEDDLLLDFLASEDFSRRLYLWMTTLEVKEPIARVANRALQEEERHYAWAARRSGVDVRPVS